MGGAVRYEFYCQEGFEMGLLMGARFMAFSRASASCNWDAWHSYIHVEFLLKNV